MKQFCRWILFILPLFVIMGCTKNYTKNYLDSEDPGLSIFSNTQKNIMTCYANGRAWHTNNRIAHSGFGGGTNYEIYIYKRATSSLFDTIQIEWDGNFENSPNSDSRISLTLPITKNLPQGFNALEGKRLVFDTTKGFYSTSLNGFNDQNIKGWGSIYFLKAHVDSIGPNDFRGSMSGLFEASFGNNNFTRGRFDHSLDNGNLRIY